MNRCRSCNAEIIWAKNAVNGLRNPIDASPTPDGNIRLEFRGIGQPPVAHYYGKTARELLVEKHGDKIVWYKSHFATCPNARQHKKK